MTLRQRIPFKFQNESEDEDEHVLDEQEQEELIEDLRKQGDLASRQYLILLQVMLALSCLLHLYYFFLPSKVSPFAVLVHDAQHRTIPLPSLFALIHILIHLHLALHSLPEKCPMSDQLYVLYRTGVPLPLSLTHPVSLVTPTLAPLLALILRCDLPEIAWWCVAGLMSWLVWTVREWIRQSEDDIRQLDTMRYDARGA